VDRHIAEDSARDSDIRGRRRLRIPAGDGEVLKPSDIALLDPSVQLGEVRVEPTVEAEDNGH
jgi:hypothetical protein